jgi:ATP/maltotriose-dependent transcriptional regulator MalT
VTGDFHAALTEAAHAHRIGEQIDDPRLQTYAGFMEAWVETSRGNCDKAVAVGQRSLAQAPDRVSHAFASTILGYALVQGGRHDAARGQLEPLVGVFESFGFPQWQGWAAVLTAEAYRLAGACDMAASVVERGLSVARHTQYWYAVGFGERIAARIARDRDRLAESSTAFGQALQTFARIGAGFEESQTRKEATQSGRTTAHSG